MHLATPLLCFGSSLVALCTCCLDANAAAGRVMYRGQLVQQDVGGGSVPVRSFAVTAWIPQPDSSSALFFRVDDEGRGRLPWWNQIGRIETSAADAPHPLLRHVHLGRPYTLTLPGPIVTATQPLKVDSTFELDWEGRRTTFTVSGDQRLNNHDCWVISGDSGSGRRQTWHIQKSTNLVIRATSRVFIGQGERFELQLELDNGSAPDAELLARELAVAVQIAELRDSLNFADPSDAEELNPEQLTQVETTLPALSAAAKGTDWERFVESIAGDADASRDRDAALDKLAQRIVGQPAPNTRLVGLDSQPVDWRTSNGDIVVLHFWDYRGKPESPFGQVGYLDFLAGKLKNSSVRIYGVAVDERAADPQQLRIVQREIKKFNSEFIRISYPIAIDDGSLLQKLGDPRELNTPLPLWVVIDKSGKVAEYRAGLYTIDPNRGLTELHEAITGIATSK